MATPIARVHLKMAHAALPPLLSTPPKWKMLPTPPCVAIATILPKPLAKPSRAESHERWNAHKAKPPPSCCPAASSLASSGRRSPMLAATSSGAPRASSSEISEPRKNPRTWSPPSKPGRADSAERWDAHKKAAMAIPASSSSSAMSSVASSSMSPISPASSAERWDVHKKRCPPQAELFDDGDRGSTGSCNDMDIEEGEEILWKPRALYSGPGFAGAAPQPSMLPMPTAFLVPVA